jgi:hypothetical protein
LFVLVGGGAPLEIIQSSIDNQRRA